MTIRNSMTGLAALALVLTAPGLAAMQTEASCDTYGNSDESLWARYRDTGTRATLDLALKIPGALMTGPDRVRTVFLDARPIGTIRLQAKAPGWYSGGLSFDSYAGQSLGEVHTRPFPANWSGVYAGAEVRVGSLSCRLAG